MKRKMRFGSLVALMMALALSACQGTNQESTGASSSGGTAISSSQGTGNIGEGSGDDGQETEIVEEQGLEPPIFEKVVAKPSGKIKLIWSEGPEAKKYIVLRSGKEDGKYKKAGLVKETVFVDKDTTPYKEYYYRIQAKGNGKKGISEVTSAKARKRPEVIDFVGDSVMSGFSVYQVATDPREKSFAEVSRTVALIDEMDLPNVIASHPDRTYIMVGTNDCVGVSDLESVSSVLDEYGEMLDKLLEDNPNMEIIIMGIGPTNSEKVSNEILNGFNDALQKLADKRDGVYYFDTPPLLKNKDGALKAKYAASDGVHWSKAAYEKVYKKLMKYVKKMATWGVL